MDQLKRRDVLLASTAGLVAWGASGIATASGATPRPEAAAAMKICRDCVVTLTLKGLDGHHGGATIYLQNNNGDDVSINADLQQPTAERRDILLIGNEAGDSWEFAIPGTHSGTKLTLPKSAAFDSLAIAIDVIFDPTADAGNVKVLDMRVEVELLTNGARVATATEDCCVTACGMTVCDYPEASIFCNGVWVRCRVEEPGGGAAARNR